MKKSDKPEWLDRENMEQAGSGVSETAGEASQNKEGQQREGTRKKADEHPAIEEEMDLVLETLAIDQDMDFDQKLEKLINRKMRKVALRTAIIVVLIAAVIFLGISPLMNLHYTNPAKIDDMRQNDVFPVLDAYYKTTHPYVELWSVQAEKEGFGCYTLNLDLSNYHRQAAATLEMKRGRISVTSDSMQCLNMLVERFYTGQEEEPMGEEDRKILMKEIKALPDSAHLYLSVSAKKPQDVSALLKQTSDDFELEWMQVYQPENEFQGGIGIYSDIIGPGFDSIREEVTVKSLKEEYLKNLKLLKENQEFWRGLDLYSGNSLWAESEKEQLLQKAISAAEKSPKFQTQNYCVSGTKKEILEFLQEGEYNRIGVDNVQFSIFN